MPKSRMQEVIKNMARCDRADFCAMLSMAVGRHTNDADLLAMAADMHHRHYATIPVLASRLAMLLMQNADVLASTRTQVFRNVRVPKDMRSSIS